MSDRKDNNIKPEELLLGGLDFPEEIPILPVRDIVVFPYMILPLYVGREISTLSVNEAMSSNRMMLLVAQKDSTVEDPTPDDIYSIGTLVTILRMIKNPEERLKILVQGLVKVEIKKFISTSPFLKATIAPYEELNEENPNSVEAEALRRRVKEQMAKIVELGKGISPDIIMVADEIEDSGKLADLVASNIGLKVADAQQVIEIKSPRKRLKKIGELLAHELKLLTVQEKIQIKAQDEMTKSQKEYYLREQLRQIQKELGDTDDKLAEINELRDKVEAAKMPEPVFKEAEKQLDRLAKMHPESAEATTVRTYIEWLVEIPWSISTKENINIQKAKKVLDEDHYDLEKIKQRILEYLGVAKLKKDIKGPILCFAGPPGTGKTSLGKSIARALGRKFTRMSLGGVRDESEIRGHRRTYIGALPGRIIQGIKTSGSNNPVFMLDEIDKLGADFRGDPSSALLEVLDPEQNNSFTDHYLGVPFDLSKTLFIATANMMETIPSALRDRMEVITLSGYTEEEKLGIAKKYLVPRQIKENGMKRKMLTIHDSAIRSIINGYTREAGLRNLEREIANVCRKVALKIVESRNRTKSITVSEKDIASYLGTEKYMRESEKEKPQVGVATGLAWTQAGGTLMHIEVTTMKGKGALTLTGKLGDVMRESAQAAYSYCRANAKRIGISEDISKSTDIHVHVPSGSVPKDGPSAGITIAVALASALSGKPVRNDIAMTGEITLRGRVLPIGGLKEKTLAALQAGIHKVIIPDQNKADLREIPDYIKSKVDFISVKTVDEVLNNAFKNGIKPHDKVSKKKTAKKKANAKKAKSKKKSVKKKSKKKK
jgi:ATP-dependent Lon protease